MVVTFCLFIVIIRRVVGIESTAWNTRHVLLLKWRRHWWRAFKFKFKFKLRLSSLIMFKVECIIIKNYIPCSMQTLQHRPGRRTGSSHVGLGHSFLMLRQSVRPAMRRFFCTCNSISISNSVISIGTCVTLLYWLTTLWQDVWRELHYSV